MINYNDIAEKVSQIEGYLLKDEDRFLFEKVKELHDDAIIVEIGSFKGKSSVAMGYACVGTNKKIYCIDPWISEEYFKGTKHENEDIWSAWSKSRKDNNLEDYLIPLKGYSTDILPKWKTICSKPIDMVFIDGDHSFKGVTDDFFVAIPQIKEKGLMIFQDVASYFEGCEEFWYKIGTQKLENHFYFKSLACGTKAELKNTKQYNLITKLREEKNYELASEIIKSLMLDYPFSLELKILDTQNEISQGNLSIGKYKMMKILDEYPNDTDTLLNLSDLLWKSEAKSESINYLVKYIEKTNDQEAIAELEKKVFLANLFKKDLELKTLFPQNYSNLVAKRVFERLKLTNNQYLVSCIILNTEDDTNYLKRSLLNLLNQKNSDELEIIILTKSSISDEIGNIISENDRIHLINFNTNYACAINKAIEKASGKYIKIFNVYEIIYNNFLERLVKTLELNEFSSLAYYDYSYTDKTHVNANSYNIDMTLEMPIFKDIKTLFNFNKINTNCIWKRSLHSKYGLLKESLNDFYLGEFMLRVAKNEMLLKDEKTTSIFSGGKEFDFNFYPNSYLWFFYNKFNKDFYKDLSEPEKEMFTESLAYRDKMYNYEFEVDKNNYIETLVENDLFIKNNYQIVDFISLLDIHSNTDSYLILKIENDFANLDESLVDKINKTVDVIFVKSEEAKALLYYEGIDEDRVKIIDFDNIYNNTNLIVNTLSELKNTSIVRFSINELINTNFSTGIKLYETKNYLEADKHFEKALKYDSLHYESLYFLGLCKIENRDYESGIYFLCLANDIKPSLDIKNKIDFYSKTIV